MVSRYLLTLTLLIQTFLASAQIYTSEIEIKSLADGEVGIGTDDPEEALDVAGSLVIGLKTLGGGTMSFRRGSDGLSTGHMGYYGLNEGNNFAFRNLSLAGYFSFFLNVNGAGEAEVARFSNDGSFTVIGTNTATGGTITAINPGTSPRGSSITLSSPGRNPGIVITEGDGSGQVLRRWDLYSSGGTFYIKDKTSEGDRLSISTNGNVGIGYPNPSEKLHVNGNVLAANLSITSDLRLKKDIKNFNQGLDLVQQINPVKFRYKNRTVKTAKDDSQFLTSGRPNLVNEQDNREYIGVIAQDIQKIAPNLVNSFINEEGQEVLTINYTAFTFILINALKEQQAEIELLKKKVSLLLEKNNASGR